MTGRRRTLRRWWREEHGQATVELVALVPFLVIAALVAIQMQLFVSTASAAEHAARNASRAFRKGDDPVAAAHAAVSPGQSARLAVNNTGERVTARLTVPNVASALNLGTWTVERSAALPRRIP